MLNILGLSLYTPAPEKCFFCNFQEAGGDSEEHGSSETKQGMGETYLQAQILSSKFKSCLQHVFQAL